GWAVVSPSQAGPLPGLWFWGRRQGPRAGGASALGQVAGPRGIPHPHRYTASMLRPPAKFCRHCGTAVHLRLPDDGDTRERAVCPACGMVHYDNPLNVVGTVPVWGPEGEQVLLCKRNIEPRWGKWTLPAGFMELGETTAEGALRETDEEAGAQIELGELFTLMNVPRVGQVHLFYRA